MSGDQLWILECAFHKNELRFCQLNIDRTKYGRIQMNLPYLIDEFWSIRVEVAESQVVPKDASFLESKQNNFRSEGDHMRS